MSKIKQDARKNAARYEKDGNITFPWAVVVGSGINH